MKLLILLLKKVVEDVAMANKVIIRHRKPTTRAHLLHLHHNNTPRARNQLNPPPSLPFSLICLPIPLPHKLLKFPRPVLQTPPPPPKTNDLGWSIKGVEHDTDTCVAGFVQVADGFVAAAGEFLVPELGRGGDAEIGAAFGGDVDVARRGEWGGGDVEEVLGQDPGDEGGGDGFVVDAHTGGGVGAGVCAAWSGVGDLRCVEWYGGRITLLAGSKYNDRVWWW